MTADPCDDGSSEEDGVAKPGNAADVESTVYTSVETWTASSATMWDPYREPGGASWKDGDPNPAPSALCSCSGALVPALVTGSILVGRQISGSLAPGV